MGRGLAVIVIMTEELGGRGLGRDAGALSWGGGSLSYNPHAFSAISRLMTSTKRLSDQLAGVEM